MDDCGIIWLRKMKIFHLFLFSLKDQKILELMLAKREDAKKETQKREAARTAWEVEKQKDAQAKTSAEIARRRTLSEHRRLQENRRVSSYIL